MGLLPADTRAPPAPHVGQQTGRGTVGWRLLVAFFFIRPAFEDTPLKVNITLSDGGDNGCTADVTSARAGVQSDKDKPGYMT
jgi:hypothetical protein